MQSWHLAVPNDVVSLAASTRKLASVPGTAGMIEVELAFARSRAPFPVMLVVASCVEVGLATASVLAPVPSMPAAALFEEAVLTIACARELDATVAVALAFANVLVLAPVMVSTAVSAWAVPPDTLLPAAAMASSAAPAEAATRPISGGLAQALSQKALASSGCPHSPVTSAPYNSASQCEAGP